MIARGYSVGFLLLGPAWLWWPRKCLDGLQILRENGFPRTGECAELALQLKLAELPTGMHLRKHILKLLKDMWVLI